LTTLAKKRADYAERLERALRRIVQVLSAWGEVERISVFGSFARGRRDLGTDLDVLVLLRTEEPFVERLRRIYAAVQVDVDADILGYTPGEWEHVRETPWGRALRRDEKILYEKESG
jgi:predicted nucleotidyltransferase